MEKFTIKFYRLSCRGNLKFFGSIETGNRNDVDKIINDGKKLFGNRLRLNDNMQVFIIDDEGNTLSDYTFEPCECK